jgi:hypothetical protein
MTKVLLNGALGNNHNAGIERDKECGDCCQAENLVGARHLRKRNLHVCPPDEQVNNTLHPDEQAG